MLLCSNFYYSVAGKMQHSVWAAEAINSNLEMMKSGSPNVVPSAVLAKRFSFRRIWQGKGSHTAASKVLEVVGECFVAFD